MRFDSIMMILMTLFDFFVLFIVLFSL